MRVIHQLHHYTTEWIECQHGCDPMASRSDAPSLTAATINHVATLRARIFDTQVDRSGANHELFHYNDDVTQH
jgi:hypothetical protein